MEESEIQRLPPTTPLPPTEVAKLEKNNLDSFRW